VLSGFAVSIVSPPMIVFLIIDLAEAKVRCGSEALLSPS
jgi:hypothetical protein